MPLNLVEVELNLVGILKGLAQLLLAHKKRKRKRRNSRGEKRNKNILWPMTQV